MDYRNFRLSKINTDEFRHVKLLLFWPLFGIMFSFVERFYHVGSYYVMHCAFDDAIPFCEWFLIPYLFLVRVPDRHIGVYLLLRRSGV